MSIRSRVYLSLTFLALLSISMVLLAFGNARAVTRELAKADTAQETAKSVAELSLLTESYLAYGEQRMETQWLSKAGRIGAALEGHDALAGAEQHLLLTLEALTRSFTTLVEIKRPGESAMTADHVGARMRMDSQNMLFRTFEIARESRERALALQRRSAALIALLGVLLVTAAFTTSLYLTATVSSRTRDLLRGVRRFGEGNLEYRIDPSGADEIGQLAETFNSMAADLELLIRKEERAREELQELNLELEKRVRERTEEIEAFTYSVSHDLRAPLRAVDGFTRFLEEDYQAALDAEGQRFLAVIRTNVQQMDKLITDLLALSRVSRSELAPVRTDMGALARAMYEEAATESMRNQFSLDIKPLPEALCDPSLLKQVWFNLISNALKYSTTAREKRIEIGGVLKDREVTYYVMDHGVGFDQAYAHNIFGVFQRLHRSDEFEGTGVGLAIVDRIIARHGGRVWAEGTEGEGAVFHFALPVPAEENGNE